MASNITEVDGSKLLAPLWPEGPRNRTDLHVVFDPDEEQFGDTFILPLNTDESDPDRFPTTETIESTNGIAFPIIKVNNSVIQSNLIKEFKLSSKEFIPELYLVINDENGELRFIDTPGMNNVVSVVLTHPTDGVYKKVQLNFYITSYSAQDGFIYINTEFKLEYLDKLLTKQILSKDGSQVISTYEFCESIAKDAGLGFATTEHVKDVRDNIYRLLQSEKLKQAVPKHISYAGVNNQNYMDAWIDFFGYLDLINTSWVFSEEVKPEEISIVRHVGTVDTTQNLDTSNLNVEQTRYFTNSQKKTPGSDNMYIVEYEQLTDPGSSYYSGTLTTHYSVSMQANGGTGNYERYQIQQVENSLDGKYDSSSYIFETAVYDGFEMNMHRPITKQKNLRKKWFEKQRSNMLRVKLEEQNLGVERGMIIGIYLVTSEPSKVSHLMKQGVNALATEPPEINSTEDFKEQTNDKEFKEFAGASKKEIMSEGLEFPCLHLNGTYYIDGIELYYNQENGQIEQTLYLIKTTNIARLYNKTTPVIGFANTLK